MDNQYAMQPTESQWHTAWEALAVIMGDTTQPNEWGNEVWQYMGSVERLPGRWIHQFRHRDHPTTGDRLYVDIPATAGWSPETPTEPQHSPLAPAQIMIIDRIYRHLNQDSTELFGGRLAFHCRPIALWKYFYWGFWGPNDLRHWAIQSPWITIVASKPLKRYGIRKVEVKRTADLIQ